MLVKRTKKFGMVGDLREGIDGMVDDISPVPLPTQTKIKKAGKSLGNFLTGKGKDEDD
jgi:hypothetical protein